MMLASCLPTLVLQLPRLTLPSLPTASGQPAYLTLFFPFSGSRLTRFVSVSVHVSLPMPSVVSFHLTHHHHRRVVAAQPSQTGHGHPCWGGLG